MDVDYVTLKVSESLGFSAGLGLVTLGFKSLSAI